MADTSIKVVLRMLFFFFSNANIQFDIRKQIWRLYTAILALSIIKRVELIDEKFFVKTALNENFKSFVMHVAALKSPSMVIYPC